MDLTHYRRLAKGFGVKNVKGTLTTVHKRFGTHRIETVRTASFIGHPDNIAELKDHVLSNGLYSATEHSHGGATILSVKLKNH